MVSGNKRNRKASIFQATCPACGSRIQLRKMPRRGHVITCQDCASMLVVTRLAPLKLDWAFEEPFEENPDAYDYFVKDTPGSDKDWFAQDNIQIESDYEEYEDE